MTSILWKKTFRSIGVLQEDEVEDVRHCGGRELLAIIGSSERVNSSYTAAVERAMKKRGLL